MKKTDSRECRNCHDLESMNPKFQRPRARKQHLNAFETGQTCIDCHKGIAHKEIRDQLTDEELEALEAPNPDFIRPVPEMFKVGLQEIEAEEKLLAEKAAAEKVKSKAAKAEAKKKAKAAEDERVKQAVAAALAAAQASSDKAAAESTPAAEVEAGASAGFGIDWTDVPSRQVTVFFPGQTSMEWILNGRNHGGARAFTKSGDTCISCHDKETAAMGDKLVEGGKTEPTPIPGKRGNIPVDVQAAYDDKNLYLRFEWEEGEHVDVPFVDGGKMDPENSMKIALMLATDELEYVAQAGCWATCHHDARSMPDTPDADAVAAGDASALLDISNGITKYVKESRTKIEVKGRRGKKRGGWDKLKTAEDYSSVHGSSAVMDLLRYSSGTDSTEDGYIYEQRIMSGGQGFVVNSSNQAGRWIIEIKRPLNTAQAGDVALAIDQTYNLGFAIHDDFSNARFHHVSLAYKLGFDNESAEVNAVKRQPAVVSTPVAPAAVIETKSSAPADDSAKTSFSVDWDKADGREITLFYPGQASMEWILNGRDHGGARAFLKSGDSCASCHDKETAAMGEKLVAGGKTEPTPIPGKRGSIPVDVKASYDDENLYLRFEWEKSEHTPAPFVEGGKMDPDNEMKLAMMFATDELEFVNQAGCWATCHHDTRTMPDTPEADAVAGSEASNLLDISNGITKYVKESRTKIEIKGRRGKKRGGWDKLKSAEEIQAAEAGTGIMDLMRYSSGSALTEDGSIYSQRHMDGGQGFSVNAVDQGDSWVIEFKRSLKSEKPGDISLDKTQVYNFGFAIHDDFSNARFHHVSLGYKLGFDNDGVDLNAIHQ